jgi:hypothetical protein
METGLVNFLSATLTVPSQAIHAVRRPLLLQHNSHCVLEPHGVMRRVGWKQKHIALVYVDVAKLLGSREGIVNDFEQHRAFVLIEPFGGFVNVVVCALIWAADDHDRHIVVVDAVVVDRRLEHVEVFGNPGESGDQSKTQKCTEKHAICRKFAKASKLLTHHFGILRGGPMALRDMVDEKWRCGTAPVARNSCRGTYKLWSPRAAERKNPTGNVITS